MPTPTPNTAAELSLINDAQFLEELEQTDHGIGGVSERAGARPLYNDAYAALESGLPVQAGAGDSDLDYVDPPVEAPFEPYDEAPSALAAPPESGISFVTAAIVIVACLTIGAATAAYVFQDSLTRITATRTASR